VPLPAASDTENDRNKVLFAEGLPVSESDLFTLGYITLVSIFPREELRFKKAKETTTEAHLVRHISFHLVRHLGETKIPQSPDFSQLYFMVSVELCKENIDITVHEFHAETKKSPTNSLRTVVLKIT